MSYLASQIAVFCQGRLEGADVTVTGLETLELAGPEQLTFVGTAFFGKRLAESRAAGAIVTNGVAVKRREGQAVIWVENADVAVAQVLAKLAPPLPLPELGIHATAVIHPTAKMGANIRIGPHVVIQAQARVGDGTALFANVFIGAYATLGAECVLWPNVVVRDRCTLGSRVICHPGVVIGADGFGYRFAGGRHVKIPQIGTVEIGDDVELGANTTIDRGKFSATVIGAGSKLDNLVQIGHNVRLGRHAILVAHTAIGGSTRTGDYLVMGGGGMISDHHQIGTGVQLAAMSALDADAKDGEKNAGTPAVPAKELFSDLRARRRLPRLEKTVLELQERMAKLESSAKNAGS